jgi:hypothetical protein
MSRSIAFPPPGVAQDAGCVFRHLAHIDRAAGVKNGGQYNGRLPK